MKNRWMIVALLSLPTFAAMGGCVGDLGDAGQDDPAGDVSVTTSPITTQECASTSIVNDAVATSGIDYLSPRTYSNPGCLYGAVAQINTISVQYTRTGQVHNAGITVQYADNDVGTPEACNDLWVLGILYKQVGSSWTAVAATSLTGSTWVGSGSFGFCVTPSIFFDGPTKISYHKNYRVAATAQRITWPGAISVTRRVRITTDYAVDQPQ
jgi:hypothetical protein